ncbi:MAG TPA: hypothetical protein PKV72_05420 [Candidatus Peribacteria bacterium]|nr:hypothetical protein [Candidatus Peribacteria bacterium]
MTNTNNKKKSAEPATLDRICRTIEQQAGQLAAKHGDRIRELLESGATLDEVAGQLIPAQVERDIDLSRSIVAAAARAVFAGNEARLNELMRKHPKHPKNAETSDAIDRRVDAPLHEIDWNLVEPELIHIVPDNLYPRGHHKAGQPMLPQIADALNAIFPNQPDITVANVSHRLGVIAKRGDSRLAA